MFGPIVIEITLAPSGVLGLGAPTVNADLTAITAANSEIGVAIAAAAKLEQQ
jgi:hypothetical protein